MKSFKEYIKESREFKIINYIEKGIKKYRMIDVDSIKPDFPDVADEFKNTMLKIVKGFELLAKKFRNSFLNLSPEELGLDPKMHPNKGNFYMFILHSLMLVKTELHTDNRYTDYGKIFDMLRDLYEALKKSATKLDIIKKIFGLRP